MTSSMLLKDANFSSTVANHGGKGPVSVLRKEAGKLGYGGNAVTFSGGATQRVVDCLPSFTYVTFNAFCTPHFCTTFYLYRKFVGRRMIVGQRNGGH